MMLLKPAMRMVYWRVKTCMLQGERDGVKKFYGGCKPDFRRKLSRTLELKAKLKIFLSTIVITRKGERGTHDAT